MQLTTDQMDLLNRRFADLAALPTRTAPPITVRTNITATGVIDLAQLAEIDAVSVPATTAVVDRRALVGDLLLASSEKPGAVAYLLTVGNRSAQSRVDALDIDASGGVVVRASLGTRP